MRKFTIAAAAISIALGLGLGTASADGKRHNHNDGVQRDHVERQAHNRKHRREFETVSVRLHQRYAHETLPLRRLLDLDRDYRGYRVKNVTVVLRPHYSHGRIALLANGQVVDRARSGEGRRIHLKLDDDRTLGRDLNRLQLDVRGRAFIDRVEVTMRVPKGRRIHAAHERDDRHDDPNRRLIGILAQILIGEARSASIAR